MTNLDSMLKSRDITFPTKVHLVKAMVFPVVMYGCESWTIKKAERPRIDAFELWCWRRLLRVPWTAKRSNKSNTKGNWSWILIGRTDAELETPILWPPHAKTWLNGKDSDAGRDWGQEEKGMTEDEMAGWHHQLDVHEFGWTPGAGDGQGSLVCSNPWGRKESDTTEWLNWTVGPCQQKSFYLVVFASGNQRVIEILKGFYFNSANNCWVLTMRLVLEDSEELRKVFSKGMNSLTSSLLLSVFTVKIRMAIDRILLCYTGFIRDKHMNLGIQLMKHLCTVRIKIHNLKVILIFLFTLSP